MPRGGEYDDGPTVASDNAIDTGENKIAGAPQGDSDVSLTIKKYIISLVLTYAFYRNQSPPVSTAQGKLHPFPQASVK